MADPRVMVDELRRWPGARAPFNRGSCHLTVDVGVDLDVLHAFAARIGLRRVWFQPLSSPHYDLTPNKRMLALELGAVMVPGLEQARARVEARRAAWAARKVEASGV